MPPLTREQLAYRRSVTARQRRQRHRRILVGVGAPVLAVLVLLLMFALIGARGTDEPRPLAAPVSTTPPSTARPSDLTIARGEGVSINLPVNRDAITAAAFHPIGDPAAVAMEATGGIPIKQSERSGRLGPETAGLDVGAPAGTPVYAPVDGVIVSIADNKVNGRIEGFEISIAPDVASRGVVVRMTNLDEPERGPRPGVGSAVRSAETLIGRVRDMKALGRLELAQFTSDSGNHVHIELIRTRADLFS